MQARHVRRFAGGGHRVQHVGVGAVPQEPDNVPRPAAGEVEDVVADLAVLAVDVRPVVGGSEAEQLRDRRGDVDESPRPRHQPVGAHPLPGDDERCPRLHHVERSVLTAMPALVLPVVGGGVDHAQVGRGRVVEELGDLCEPERVRVLAAPGVGMGALGVQPGEPVRRLVGERIGALARDLLVPAALGPPEADPPVVRTGLVRRVAVRAGPCRRWDRGPSRAAPRAPRSASSSRSAVISWRGTAAGAVTLLRSSPLRSAEAAAIAAGYRSRLSR